MTQQTFENGESLASVRAKINANATDVTTRRADNNVIVKQASDLSVIDSTKNYMIDGVVDMGSQSIEVPETGISISGLNGARDTSVLFSSEDGHVFFTTPDGGYSGGGVLESCTIDATGVGAVVWDCDNDDNSGAWDVTGVNFGRNPSSTIGLGSLSSYRQLLFSGVGLVFCKDGLTLNGEWTGVRATTSIAAVGWPAATLFKRGTSFTIDNFLSDFNFLSVDAAAIFCDFQSSDILSDGGFRLNEFRTTATDALPNIDAQDVKALFRFCEGVDDTYIGGVFTVTASAQTAITAQDTPTKFAGVTTASELSSFDSPQDCRLRYISSIPRKVKVDLSGTYSGFSNDDFNIFIRHYDSTDTLKATISTKRIRFSENGDIANPDITGFADVVFGDYFEPWSENIDDASDITLEDNSQMLILER